MLFDLNQRIDFLQSCLSAVELRFSYPGFAVEDLTLEIRSIDLVVVDQSNAADPCGRKIKRGGGAQSASADHQNGGGFELSLPIFPNTGDRKMPGVAESLFFA